MQQVEEEHRQPLVGVAAEPRRGHLEALRPAVGPQRDGLAVGDQVVHGQGERRLDHFGQPGGDVVEAAGVDRHVVAAAVDLHPGAVQLGLENRCAAELFECIDHAGGGLRQHRTHRLSDLQREIGEGVGAAGQRRGGDGRQIAAQHRRPSDRRRGNAGRPGHRIGHHTGQRALSQFAAQQPPQKRLLGLGGGAEQIGDQRGAARLRTPACRGADLGERRVDVRHGQYRCRRRGRQ